MSDTTALDPFSRRVVLSLPGADAVQVQGDRQWGPGEDQVIDIYRAPDAAGRPLPAVILITGYPDPGFQSMTGRRLKDTAPYVSWARLMAASGLTAITYTNREPVADAAALLRHLADNADALGIDAGRFGIWAGSGNVPNALALLAGGTVEVRCAALCYGYTLDLDGSTAVADASQRFRFAAPRLAVDRIPAHLPILLARAGRDEMPGLNDSMDRFRAYAASAGLTVPVLEHPTGPHAFDIMDDSDASREVVSGILDFLSGHLMPA